MDIPSKYTGVLAPKATTQTRCRWPGRGGRRAETGAAGHLPTPIRPAGSVSTDLRAGANTKKSKEVVWQHCRTVSEPTARVELGNTRTLLTTAFTLAAQMGWFSQLASLQIEAASALLVELSLIHI